MTDNLRRIDEGDNYTIYLRSPSRDKQYFCPIPIGEVLDGRYIVEEKLGNGAFSTVYRCFDILTFMCVAVKIAVSKNAKSAMEEERIIKDICWQNNLRYGMYIPYASRTSLFIGGVNDDCCENIAKSHPRYGAFIRSLTPASREKITSKTLFVPTLNSVAKKIINLIVNSNVQRWDSLLLFHTPINKKEEKSTEIQTSYISERSKSPCKSAPDLNVVHLIEQDINNNESDEENYSGNLEVENEIESEFSDDFFFTLCYETDQSSNYDGYSTSCTGDYNENTVEDNDTDFSSSTGEKSNYYSLPDDSYDSYDDNYNNESYGHNSRPESVCSYSRMESYNNSKISLCESTRRDQTVDNSIATDSKGCSAKRRYKVLKTVRRKHQWKYKLIPISDYQQMQMNIAVSKKMEEAMQTFSYQYKSDYRGVDPINVMRQSFFYYATEFYMSMFSQQDLKFMYEKSDTYKNYFYEGILDYDKKGDCHLGAVQCSQLLKSGENNISSPENILTPKHMNDKLIVNLGRDSTVKFSSEVFKKCNQVDSSNESSYYENEYGSSDISEIAVNHNKIEKGTTPPYSQADLDEITENLMGSNNNNNKLVGAVDEKQRLKNEAIESCYTKLNENYDIPYKKISFLQANTDKYLENSKGTNYEDANIVLNNDYSKYNFNCIKNNANSETQIAIAKVHIIELERYSKLINLRLRTKDTLPEYDRMGKCVDITDYSDKETFSLAEASQEFSEYSNAEISFNTIRYSDGTYLGSVSRRDVTTDKRYDDSSNANDDVLDVVSEHQSVINICEDSDNDPAIVNDYSKTEASQKATKFVYNKDTLVGCHYDIMTKCIADCLPRATLSLGRENNTVQSRKSLNFSTQNTQISYSQDDVIAVTKSKFNDNVVDCKEINVGESFDIYSEASKLKRKCSQIPFVAKEGDETYDYKHPYIYVPIPVNFHNGNMMNFMRGFTHISKLTEDKKDKTKHRCLVFELLGPSTSDLLKRYEECSLTNVNLSKSTVSTDDKKLFAKGLPIPIVKHIARQLLYSLKVLHDLDFVHTDLKPENLTFTHSFLPILCSKKMTNDKVKDFSVQGLNSTATSYLALNGPSYTRLPNESRIPYITSSQVLTGSLAGVSNSIYRAIIQSPIVTEETGEIAPLVQNIQTATSTPQALYLRTISIYYIYLYYRTLKNQKNILFPVVPKLSTCVLFPRETDILNLETVDPNCHDRIVNFIAEVNENPNFRRIYEEMLEKRRTRLEKWIDTVTYMIIKKNIHKTTEENKKIFSENKNLVQVSFEKMINGEIDDIDIEMALGSYIQFNESDEFQQFQSSTNGCGTPTHIVESAQFYENDVEYGDDLMNNCSYYDHNTSYEGSNYYGQKTVFTAQNGIRPPPMNVFDVVSLLIEADAMFSSLTLKKSTVERCAKLLKIRDIIREKNSTLKSKEVEKCQNLLVSHINPEAVSVQEKVDDEISGFVFDSSIIDDVQSISDGIGRNNLISKQSSIRYKNDISVLSTSTQLCKSSSTKSMSLPFRNENMKIYLTAAKFCVKILSAYTTHFGLSSEMRMRYKNKCEASAIGYRMGSKKGQKYTQKKTNPMLQSMSLQSGIGTFDYKNSNIKLSADEDCSEIPSIDLLPDQLDKVGRNHLISLAQKKTVLSQMFGVSDIFNLNTPDESQEITYKKKYDTTCSPLAALPNISYFEKFINRDKKCQTENLINYISEIIKANGSNVEYSVISNPLPITENEDRDDYYDNSKDKGLFKSGRVTDDYIVDSLVKAIPKIITPVAFSDKKIRSDSSVDFLPDCTKCKGQSLVDNTSSTAVTTNNDNSINSASIISAENKWGYITTRNYIFEVQQLTKIDSSMVVFAEKSCFDHNQANRNESSDDCKLCMCSINFENKRTHTHKKKSKKIDIITADNVKAPVWNDLFIESSIESEGEWIMNNNKYSSDSEDINVKRKPNTEKKSKKKKYNCDSNNNTLNNNNDCNKVTAAAMESKKPSFDMVPLKLLGNIAGYTLGGDFNGDKKTITSNMLLHKAIQSTVGVDLGVPTIGRTLFRIIKKAFRSTYTISKPLQYFSNISSTGKHYKLSSAASSIVKGALIQDNPQLYVSNNPESTTSYEKRASSYMAIPTMIRFPCRNLDSKLDVKTVSSIIPFSPPMFDVKLSDFGNVVSMKSEMDRKTLIQTPSYRAPEIILGMTFDTKADIFSAACVIWELLTGDKLFNISDDDLPNKINYNLISGERREWLKHGSRQVYGDCEIWADEAHLAAFFKALPIERDDEFKAYLEKGEYSNALIDFITAWPIHYSVLTYKSLKSRLENEYGFLPKEAEEIQEFLLPMLAFNHTKRVSAVEALNSPWLRKAGASDYIINKTVVSSAKE